MKTILLIVIPLTLIIGFGMFCQGMFQRNADTMAQKLEKLTEDVSQENWERAAENLKQINQSWKPVRSTWQALIDHTEVDRIDESFARIEKMISVKEQKDCLVELTVLKQCFLHIPEKEKLNLSNIF